MHYLGLEEAALVDTGAYHTAKEIEQQPGLWREIYGMMVERQAEFARFLGEAYQTVDSIILTGAGSSGFLGKALEGVFYKETGILTKSILNTDLVSHPHDYFSSKDSVLMVSFARSGNSPESWAAVQLADQLLDKCLHVIITCSTEGKLANFKTKHPPLLIALPPEANDQSLAMTSSFTGMLLTGILLSRFDRLAALKQQVDLLCAYGKKMINEHLPTFKLVAEVDFKRAVFLGAGPMYGTAMESELKLQELTDGKIICKHDTFLGFRHGPKAVIDETTLVMYIFSNTRHANKYEKDLIPSMRKGKKALFEIGISQYQEVSAQVQQSIVLADDHEKLDEALWAVCTVLPAQIIGFFKSINLGLQPDSPSVHGAISRVVEGVSIYPLTPSAV